MKHAFGLALALAAALAIAQPAGAGNLFVAADGTVPANDFTNPAAWPDTAAAAVRVGWDFGTPEVALEYDFNRGGADDTLFLTGALNFGKGKFQPGIGAGIGIAMDGAEFVDDQHLQLNAGAQYYLTPRLALEGRYVWLSEAGDIGGGTGEVRAGVRLDF